MVCADDLSYTITLGSVIISVWWLCVWLPSKSWIVKPIIMFVITAIIMGLVSSNIKSGISDSPLITFSAYAGVFLFLMMLAFFFGGLVSLGVSLLFIGPGLAILQNGLNTAALDTIGSNLPPTSMIIAIVVSVAVVVALYIAFRNSMWFQTLLNAVLLSAGVVFAYRVFMARINGNSELCCSSSDFNTCPVWGDFVMLGVFIGAIVVRLLMDWQWKTRGRWLFIHWKDREKDILEKKKKQWEKEQQKKLAKRSGKKPISDSESDAEVQRLLESEEDIEKAVKPEKKVKNQSRSPFRKAKKHRTRDSSA
jgi:hypothetical protein